MTYINKKIAVLKRVIQEVGSSKVLYSANFV